MVIVFFAAVSPTGDCQHLSFGGSTMEDCFNALTIVVNEGFQLTHIELLEEKQTILLPVDAFDGRCVLAPLQQLQQEWEQLLYTH